MSLPEIAQLEYSEATEAGSAAVHKTFDWDFEANDFKRKDGKLVEVTGLDYVKIWIKKALLSKKQSLIYSQTNYGSEHMTLIGSDHNPAFLQSEYERMIQEALLQNDAITVVSNFTFTQSGSGLQIEFEAISIYGTVQEGVVV
jgi:hypothetical protein